jgi:hypothetical protein
MTEKNIDARESASPIGVAAAAREQAAGKSGDGSNSRRRLLIGGTSVAAPLFVTLASRPALATCTISGMISGVGSHLNGAVSSGTCGSTAADWLAATPAAWTRAGFTKSSAALTSAMLPTTRTYTDAAGQGSAAWTITGTLLFTNLLSGNFAGGTVTLKYSESIGMGVKTATIDTSNATFKSLIQQYIAAVLNAGFFGSTLFNHVPLDYLKAVSDSGVNASVTMPAQTAANTRLTAATTAAGTQNTNLQTANNQGA